MKVLISIVLIFFSFTVSSQSVNYFTKYRAIADEMEATYDIPACVILAIGYIESGGGTSKVGRLLNNHFGIVGSSKPEISGYKSKYKYYPTVKDSFIGLCKLIASKKYYAGLKGTKDIKKWLKAIAAGGYAADAEHWSKTIAAIAQKHCKN